MHLKLMAAEDSTGLWLRIERNVDGKSRTFWQPYRDTTLTDSLEDKLKNWNAAVSEEPFDPAAHNVRGLELAAQIQLHYGAKAHVGFQPWS